MCHAKDFGGLHLVGSRIPLGDFTQEKKMRIYIEKYQSSDRVENEF